MTTSAVRGPAQSARCPEGTWEDALARPHPRLRPGVLGYHGFQLRLERPRRRLEVPIGAVTLLLGFEEPIRIIRAGRPDLSLVSALTGLATGPAIGEHSGRLSGIEVLLTPWAAFALFGTAQHELADHAVDLSAVRPPGAGAWAGSLPARDIGDLSAALAALPDWNERFGLLDDVLTYWAGTGTPASPRVVRAWGELVRTGGALPVSRLAEEVDWSVRQLEKRFREQIGVTPKAAARVLRLQRARRLLATGHGQAETAALCGFYDQAHLSGEFRAMTGCTPGRFATARSTPPGARTGPPRQDRLAGETTSLVLPPGHDARFSKTGRLI